MDFETFDKKMEIDGWAVFESVVDHALIDEMISEFEPAYQRCRTIQLKNGIPDNNEYTLHHLVQYQNSYFRYLENLPVIPYMERYFGGAFILNSFGGAINTHGSRSYAHNVHRDIRSFSHNLPLLLNTLVMFDDFIPENGATWLYAGSHKMEEKPDDDTFKAHAKQVVAPKGSVLMFNSNLWHAGGDNHTDLPRRSVTPMFSKPYIKQQCDYPRVIGYEHMDDLSDWMCQVLGFYSRVPASLDEWYQPPEKRMYRRNQG